jgi:hypothetical protein
MTKHVSITKIHPYQKKNNIDEEPEISHGVVVVTRAYSPVSKILMSRTYNWQILSSKLEPKPNNQCDKKDV